MNHVRLPSRTLSVARLALGVSLLALASACGNGAAFEPPPVPDSGACTPDVPIDCTCDDGTTGVASCSDDGVAGQCMCDAGDGSLPIDGAGDDTAVADATDARTDTGNRPDVAMDVATGPDANRFDAGFDAGSDGGFDAGFDVVRPDASLPDTGVIDATRDVPDVTDVTVTDTTSTSLACADIQLGSALGSPVATGTTVGRTNRYRPVACGLSSTGTNTAPDLAYGWTAPSSGSYVLSTVGSSYDTVLYVRSGSCTGTEAACSDDVATSGSYSQLTLTASAGQAYVIVVDGFDTSSGTFRLAITAVCTSGATQSCYSGTAATRNVGRCRAGTQTCSGGVFGTTCTGEVDPATSETCGNNIDDDCNGLTDDGCICGTLTNCSGTCANLQTDTHNCGACGTTCSTGQTCVTGLCCAAGQSRCNNTCVNTQTDLNNCGGCGMVCSATFPQTAACVSGSCLLTCGSGYHQCNTACASSTSISSCGSSCTACPSGVNSAATCNGTTCALSCSSGYANCDNVASTGCEANLSTSVDNCGACGVMCPMYPHAARLCTTANYPYTPACGAGTCDAGWTNCNGTATDGCEVQTATDANNCGTCNTHCATGQTCVSGTCQLVCTGSQVVCNAQCVDTQSSATNCGTCGNACGGTERCTNGRCTGDSAVEVTAGTSFKCVRRQSGAISCWGIGTTGQLGNGAYNSSLAPVAVSVINDATQISAGSTFACAVRSDGTVWCWGSNSNYTLGTSSVSYSATPLRVGTLTGVAEVRSGSLHACARTTAGAVYCWGYGGYGATGTGSTSSVYTPTLVNGLSGTAVSLAAGLNHTCAVDNIGLVDCWGSNSSGQLGVASTTYSTTPVVVNGLAGVSRMGDSLGTDSTCAIRSAGTIACWGGNTVGQLGNGSTTATPSVVTVTGLTGVDRVATGEQFSCARKTNNEVWCWGNDANGQLGAGSYVSSPRPVQPIDRFAANAPFTGVSSVATGGNAACAVTTAGGVRCWGSNVYGQIGDRQLVGGTSATETATDRVTPQPVVGFAPVVAEDGACADGRDNDGDGRTDGDDTDCATNLGSSLGRAVFTSLPTGAWANYNRASCGRVSEADVMFKWVAPASSTFSADTRESSYDTVLAVRSGSVGGGEVACNDNESTLTTTSRITFTATAGSTYYFVVDGYRATGAIALSIHDTVADAACTNTQTDRLNCGSCGHACSADQRCSSGSCVSDRVVEVVAGAAFACARREVGGVSCWGANAVGQLGNGGVVGVSQPATVPIPISYVTDATQLCAGTEYACALHADGKVSCWGADTNGQLGDNTGNTQKWPVNVGGLPSAAEVRCGPLHACARTTAGDVYCWGNNGSGRLGDGTTTNRAVATRVTGLARASVSVYAGGTHSCSVAGDGTAQCWGDDTSGQLGDGGTLGASNAPVTVTGVTNASRLAEGSGTAFTCARNNDGTAQCWGRNVEGQLGRGAVSSAPGGTATVSGLIGVVQMAAGGASVCARVAGGTVSCWGDDTSGQLGLGTTINGPSPAQVRNRFANFAVLDNVAYIGAGPGIACAVRGDASVLCWGDDTSNRLGDWQRITQATSRWYPQPVVAYGPLAGEDGNCTDGVDNDNDNALDGLDPDCATDITSAMGTGSFPLVFDGRNGNYNAASCGGTTGRDTVLRWRAPSTATYTFDTRSSGITTTLSLRNGAYDGAELGCGTSSSARISYAATANQTIYVVVDTNLTTLGGNGTLVVTSP